MPRGYTESHFDSTMSQGKSIPTVALSNFASRVALIEKFIAREGHADIPLEQQEDGQPIGYWCSNWRFRLETAIDTIPAEQLAVLRNIGFLPSMVPSAKTATPTPSPFPFFHPAPVAVQQKQINQATEDIPEWMTPPQKAPEETLWFLPVGNLRCANLPPAQTKVALKKRRTIPGEGLSR